MLIDSDKIALIREGKEISYHTLLQKIYVVSNTLNDIKENDKVLVFSEPRIGYAYALFSIWAKKASYSTWFHNLNADFLKTILEDIKPVAVFVSKKTYPLLKQALEKITKEQLNLTFEENTKFFHPKVILINELEKIPVTDNTPIADLQLDASNIAFIVYTAGITNKHKPIELSFSNIMYVYNELIKNGYYKPDDKVLSYLPFYNNWILLSTLVFPLLCGCTCVFATDNIENIIKNISNHKVSIVVAVKKVYTDLLELLQTKKLFNTNTLKYKIISKINNKKISEIAYKKIHNLLGNSIRYFLTVGAKVVEEIYVPMLALGFEIFEGYGMAETSSLITYPTSKRTDAEYVGKILNGLEYKIINNELVLNGENIGKQYYNRNELNKITFNNEWFFTNDVIEIEDNGMIKLLGRVGDEVVLKSGRVVVLAELESKLDKMKDYINECGVFFDDNIFKIVIVPAMNMIETYGVEDHYLVIHSILRWKVIEHYNHGVQPYKRITNVIITEQKLPRSTSGKIKRYLLKDFEYNV